MHSLDVYFRDNDPRDPHDVNPRIFLHPFDGTVHTKHGELISAYDTEDCINMSDAELEGIAKLIPIEGTKGMGFVPEDHSLEKILRTFYPNHAWTKARQQLMELVLQKEEDEDDHRADGWEEDNAAAEVFCNNTASYTRLKHIDLRQQWVALIRNAGVMVPKHIDTKLNLADMFTKGLTGIILQEMTGRVLTKMLPFLNKDYEGSVKRLYETVSRERQTVEGNSGLVYYLL